MSDLYMTVYMKPYREQRYERGLCRNCPSLRDSAAVHCAYCRRKALARERARKAKAA